MSTNDVTNVPVAVLRLPKLNSVLITFAKSILDAFTGNSALPSPSPTLTVLAADIDALDKAETQAATRTRGATKVRDAKKQKVIQDLRHLRDYVQSVVEALPTPADAGAVITNAGMSIRSTVKPGKPTISVSNGANSGSVVLVNKAVARSATYFWQHSLDQVNWTAVPETMKVKTVVTGLIPAQTYHFRFRTLTRAGHVDFSPVVSIIVQ